MHLSRMIFTFCEKTPSSIVDRCWSERLHHKSALSKVFKPVGRAKRIWREAAAHHRVGRRAKKSGACVGRPRLGGLKVERYAALAFLTAVGFAGFGWTFAVVFLAACAFSFAANSALTFWAMASVSTL